MRQLAAIALLGLVPATATERPVPFKVGETLTYDVSWSTYITAGTVVASVKEKKASYGGTAYYIVAEGRPTPLLSKLYSLYYKADTLIDTSTLLPQRGSIYSEEGSRHKFKTTLFNRRTNQIHFEHRSATTVTSDFAAPPFAQDALSALYVLRAIPLKGGDRMTMPVSDDGINYKGTFTVAGREPVTRGVGTVQAWKLALSLVDDKNHPVGRNLTLWISDDARRLPLKIQAELPVGSFSLALRDAR